jgi:hypothetical protein
MSTRRALAWICGVALVVFAFGVGIGLNLHGNSHAPVHHKLGAVPNGVLPAGGTTGQSLTKASNANYNTHWETITGGGGGKTQAEIEEALTGAAFTSGNKPTLRTNLGLGTAATKAEGEFVSGASGKTVESSFGASTVTPTAVKATGTPAAEKRLCYESGTSFVWCAAGGGALVETGTNLAGGKESLNVAGTAAEFMTGYGVQSCKAATTGASSTDCIGYQAGNAYKKGKYNVLVGDDNMWLATELEGETAIGTAAGEEAETGSESFRETLIGNDVGQHLTKGHDSTFVGAEAGRGPTEGKATGHEDVGVGRKAEFGKNTAKSTVTHEKNACLGTECLRELTSGNDNVAVGNYSGTENESVEGMVELGFAAGNKVKTGEGFCDLIGNKVGQELTTCANKLIIGNGSGAKQLIEGELTGTKAVTINGALTVESCTGCGSSSLTWTEVEEFNAKLEPITAYGAHVEAANLNGLIYLRGGMVAKTSEEVNSGGTIFKLPAADRPEHERTVVVGSTSTAATINLNIATTGVVTSKSKVTANPGFAVQGTFSK